MVISPVELIAGADPAALVYRTCIVRYGALLLPVLLFFAAWGMITSIIRKDKVTLPFFLLSSCAMHKNKETHIGYQA